MTVLYTLMYSSVAVFAMNDDEIAALLSRSRERNAADDITGLLVYIRLDFDRAAFLQVLEGPRSAVDVTYGRIERDELHSDLAVLLRSPIEAVRFGEWSMKFATLEESGLREAIGDGICSGTTAWLRDRAIMDRVIASISES